MKLLAAVLFAIVPMFAYADIYKCTQADGSLRIGDEPCPPKLAAQPAVSRKGSANPSNDSAPGMGKLAANSPGNCGMAISAAENPMLKLATDEREIARFSLNPGETREVSYSATSRQNLMYRVAFNEGMRCKYPNGPVGMSTDGQTWMHSYYAGQPFTPVNGKISLMLKNTGQEVVNVLVVTTER